jgi:hypothetical protein
VCGVREARAVPHVVVEGVDTGRVETYHLHRCAGSAARLRGTMLYTAASTTVYMKVFCPPPKLERF